jgi:elongation factor Ts
MSITAQQVKALRDVTGAGMMDCKTALTETGGDTEAAIDWLRKKGLSKAAKKSGRIAAEGLIGVAASGKAAAMVEVNSETDFVARNEQFQALVRAIAEIALTSGGDLGRLLAAPFAGTGRTVEAEVTDRIATIGENISVRRTALLEVGEGVVATYVHNAVADGLGKMGVLVAIESAGDAAILTDIGRKVAMHVAATNPLALSAEELDPAVVAREREVYADQARQSGKPENIIDKMVEGRLRKFYEEVVLLKQAFVVDPDKTVEQAVKDREADAGAPIKVVAFVRYAVGEGIEREEADFAAEVAATAGR